jgi:hypothetical protein
VVTNFDFKGQRTEFRYDRYGRVTKKFYFVTSEPHPSNSVSYAQSTRAGAGFATRPTILYRTTFFRFGGNDTRCGTSVACGSGKKNPGDKQCHLAVNSPSTKPRLSLRLDSPHFSRKAIEGDFSVSESPSLSEIASQLGCDQTTLVRRFPELAKKVKERHRQYCAVRKVTRAQHLESIVRKVTIDIHNSGNYPSQYKVRQALPCSIDMRDPPANKAWKQTLVELGLDVDRERLATEA